jgi:hypothetical protein
VLKDETKEVNEGSATPTKEIREDAEETTTGGVGGAVTSRE